MKCYECDKEIGKTMFFRQGQEKEKFCSNDCCDKYWEKEILQTHCYNCNRKIKEGDYYYNHNGDPNLKVCTFCHRWGGGKSQAEKDKEKNKGEIAKLKGEIKNLEKTLENNPPNKVEYQIFLNSKKQRLQELEKQQNNNDPNRQRGSNKNIPNSNTNNNSPNQNQSSPNPDDNPILPNSVKDWFRKNSVKLIKLEGNEWVIEYNDGSKLTTPVANVSELQGTKSYLQALGKNSLSALELNISSNQPSNNPPSNSRLPLYIGGGVIIFLLVVVIMLLARKKKSVN